MTIAPRLRPAVLEAKAKLAAGRLRLRERHAQGSPGIQVATGATDLLDGIVLDLFEQAMSDLGHSPTGGLRSHVALVAHGGYGRRDVAPYSDVDLMILHAPGAIERVTPLAERMLRDLCDAGLDVGQSVRTARQAVQLAASDASIFTSLAESRYLAGSVGLYRRFFQRFQQMTRRRRRRLIKAIATARRDERYQYGETVYLLEPNIKRSRGGLRDLQLLRWIGFARYGIAEADGLRRRGVLPEEDYRRLREAWGYLLRLRNEMHFHAGKAHDVLDRVEQVRLAEAFGYGGTDGLLPVEQFMREHFRHTDAVSNAVSRFVAGALSDSRLARAVTPLLTHQVEGDFRVGRTQISATPRGLTKLRGQLSEVLRLADLANLYDKGVAPATAAAIRAAAPAFSDQLDDDCRARFASLLAQPLRLGELLRALHEWGVLEKIIPHFGHARSLLQFNEYHQYTVDEHCIRAVECCAELRHDQGPLGDCYRNIRRKGVLHLALLIHDLGKGFAENHCDVGLRIAGEVAARLQLSADDTQALEFLVHQHLMMSHLGFRRDTTDEQLLLRFAFDVGSPELLQMLYVLTCADFAAVGPGVLNDWKVDVLTSLYQRTMHHLAVDANVVAPQRQLERLRDEVRACLGEVEDQGWYRDQVDALRMGFFERRTSQEIADQLRSLHELAPGDVITRARYLAETGTLEFTVATHESVTPGVFHRLTAALSSKGLEILAAEINTLGRGLILDRFVVSDPDYPDEPPPHRLDAVLAALRDVLLKPGAAPPPFRRVFRAGQGRRIADLAPQPPQVRTDNNTSRRFTVIDIFATDRTGLLSAITHCLFELGLSVGVARIATYEDRVVDVFYVTDQGGGKVEDDARLEEIRRRLLEEIQRHGDAD